MRFESASSACTSWAVADFRARIYVEEIYVSRPGDLDGRKVRR